MRILGGTPEGKLSVFCSFQTSIIDSQYKDAPLPLDESALYLQNRSSIRCLPSAVQLRLALQLFDEGINTPPVLLEKSSDQADEPHSSVYPTILFNMFSRAATTFFYASVAFGLLAAATPNPGEKRWGTPTKTVTVTPPASTATEPASNCGTGKLQCCNSVQSVSTPYARGRL